MDTTAVALSLKLAAVTLLLLMPGALALARWLAVTHSRIKPWVEGLVALPLVLPPTVIGYYLLVSLGAASPLGRGIESLTGQRLVFSFAGLVFASVLVNIPFAVQPMQRAFEAIAPEVREAAQCCGLTFAQALARIELPLAWPGILSAAVLSFAHTLGEFGVVLMVGGNIPGQTQTIAISIYDRVQAFDTGAAGTMALLLLVLSLGTIALSYGLGGRLMQARAAR